MNILGSVLHSAKCITYYSLIGILIRNLVILRLSYSIICVLSVFIREYPITINSGYGKPSQDVSQNISPIFSNPVLIFDFLPIFDSFRWTGGLWIVRRLKRLQMKLAKNILA
jgi:hypothetical protein